MSAQIRYKNEEIVTFEKGTITLHTDGGRLDGDVEFVVTEENLAEMDTLVGRGVYMSTCKHVNTTTNTIPATCTDGSIIDTCDECGAIISAITIPALGHNLKKNDSLSVLPSCKGKKAGYDLMECQNCDYTEKVAVEFVLEDPTQHADAVYQGVLREGSCEKSKIDAWYCESCEIGFIVEDDSMVGKHEVVAGSYVDAVAPTCTDSGIYAHFICSKCSTKVYINDDGEYVVYENDSELVSPPRHDLIVDNEAVPPTCTTTGLTEGSHCSRCNHKVEQEIVDVISHDLIVDKAVPPTCTTTGLTEGAHCSRCNHKVAQKIVDALGHTTTCGTCGTCGEEIALTADLVKIRMQSLINKANETTKKSVTDLTEAAKNLVEGYEQGEDSPLPIEISAETDMNTVLDTAEVGSVYKYMGETTDTYESGALYLVEAVSE